VIPHVQDPRLVRRVKRATRLGRDKVKLPPDAGRVKPGPLSRGPYIPRDRKDSLLQTALAEDARRAESPVELEFRSAIDPCAKAPADSSDDHAGDEWLAGQLGPYDIGWVQTKWQELLAFATDGREPFRADPADSPLAPDARVLLVGDWGTGLHGARQVADQMCAYISEAEGREVHVIHLGDVYYSGVRSEYERNLLAPWPEWVAGRERLHFWNLNGNHDMYSGGGGYFGLLRAAAGEEDGWRDPRVGLFARQNGCSYFRLANPHWQLLALDSSYEDQDLQFPQEDWVKEHLRGSGGDGPRSILLSHHQLDSVQDRARVNFKMQRKLRRELRDGLVDAWFWGHEHRCIKFKPFGGVTFPRCLGHGGVPEAVEPTMLSLVKRIMGRVTSLFRGKLPFAPGIEDEFDGAWLSDEGVHWRKHGFACLDFDGSGLVASYVDQCGDAIWSPETLGQAAASKR
jgi:hypothetical protein